MFVRAQHSVAVEVRLQLKCCSGHGPAPYTRVSRGRGGRGSKVCILCNVHCASQRPGPSCEQADRESLRSGGPSVRSVPARLGVPATVCCGTRHIYSERLHYIARCFWKQETHRSVNFGAGPRVGCESLRCAHACSACPHCVPSFVQGLHENYLSLPLQLHPPHLCHLCAGTLEIIQARLEVQQVRIFDLHEVPDWARDDSIASTCSSP